jgi:uncharacterized protein YkwD
VHHFPTGPRRSARARALLPVVLAGLVVGGVAIAVPVASGVVGHGPVSLDSSFWASAPHRKSDPPVLMGVDGRTAAGRVTDAPAGSPPADTTVGAPDPTAGDPTGDPTGPATTADGTASGTATAPSSPTTSTSSSPSSSSSSSGTPSAPSSSKTPPPSSASPVAPELVPDAGDALLAAVNTARAAQGCAALTPDDTLTGRARVNSMDMAAEDTLAVQDAAGSATVLQHGADDAAAVVAAWLADTDESATLLDCSLTTAGAAEATADSGPWWTLFLA